MFAIFVKCKYFSRMLKIIALSACVILFVNSFGFTSDLKKLDRLDVEVMISSPDKWTDGALPARLVVANVSREDVACDLSIYPGGGILRLWPESRPLSSEEKSALATVISRRYEPISIAPGKSIETKFNVLDVVVLPKEDVGGLLTLLKKRAGKLHFSVAIPYTINDSGSMRGTIEIHDGIVGGDSE